MSPQRCLKVILAQFKASLKEMAIFKIVIRKLNVVLRRLKVILGRFKVIIVQFKFFLRRLKIILGDVLKVIRS